MCASLGTTGTCAFDNLEEIGPICKYTNLLLSFWPSYELKSTSVYVLPKHTYIYGWLPWSFWMRSASQIDELCGTLFKACH